MTIEIVWSGIAGVGNQPENLKVSRNVVIFVRKEASFYAGENYLLHCFMEETWYVFVVVKAR